MPWLPSTNFSIIRSKSTAPATQLCTRTDRDRSTIPSMKASVFVGTSLDGFIARPNGDFDFLPAGGGEPHGYNEFIASVDAIVIGRNTFEKVLTLGPWFYGEKRVVVLSSRSVDLSAVKGGNVE